MCTKFEGSSVRVDRDMMDTKGWPVWAKKRLKGTTTSGPSHFEKTHQRGDQVVAPKNMELVENETPLFVQCNRNDLGNPFRKQEKAPLDKLPNQFTQGGDTTSSGKGLCTDQTVVAVVSSSLSELKI